MNIFTDEDIKEIVGPWGDTPIKGYTRSLFDKIEAKLREKQRVSTLRDAAQQALEALCKVHPVSMTPLAEHEWAKAIHRLRAALAESKSDTSSDYERGFIEGMQKQMQSSVDKAINRMAALAEPQPHPPQRQPLTDEQLDVAIAQERDALLDHIYEHGTTAEGVLERVRKLAHAAIAKATGGGK